MFFRIGPEFTCNILQRVRINFLPKNFHHAPARLVVDPLVHPHVSVMCESGLHPHVLNVLGMQMRSHLHMQMSHVVYHLNSLNLDNPGDMAHGYFAYVNEISFAYPEHLVHDGVARIRIQTQYFLSLIWV